MSKKQTLFACNVCNQDKPLTEYPWRNKKYKVRHKVCKACKNMKAAKLASQREQERANKTPRTTKLCLNCWREKPVSQFYGHRRTIDGLQPHCKECEKQLRHERTL